jgi:L-lactate dehydrogenase (cytochrome)
MLRTPRRSFGNLAGHLDEIDDVTSLLAWIKQQFDPTITWDDIAWIRRLWRGKLVLKGIMDPEDARRAIDAGADAIVVSNHGGRQLDGAPASIHMLPKIVEAVKGETEVWFDGGIRSGQDVLRAVALGAKGTMIGRAFLYGLGALGEAGVRLCLEIIADELSITMGLCGVIDIDAVDAGILVFPGRWA